MRDSLSSTVSHIRAVMGAPMLRINVVGSPAPGGSKHSWVPRGRDGKPMTRPNGSIIVRTIDDANRTNADGRQPNKEWRQCVTAAAVECMNGRKPLSGPLMVHVVIFVRRPKGHYGTGRNAGTLKPDSPEFPETKPDASKLWRSTEDALTNIMFLDDSQIVTQLVSKRYAEAGQPTGALVEVWGLAKIDYALWKPLNIGNGRDAAELIREGRDG